MTNRGLIIAAVVVLLGALGANIYVGLHASDKAGGASDRAGNALHRISVVQHQLLVSQKASTKTRVTTVTSRCDLTHLILGVLERLHDPQDAAPFVASYRTCESQLQSVQHINAVTPNP